MGVASIFGLGAKPPESLKVEKDNEWAVRLSERAKMPELPTLDPSRFKECPSAYLRLVMLQMMLNTGVMQTYSKRDADLLQTWAKEACEGGRTKLHQKTEESHKWQNLASTIQLGSQFGSSYVVKWGTGLANSVNTHYGAALPSFVQGVVQMGAAAYTNPATQKTWASTVKDAGSGMSQNWLQWTQTEGQTGQADAQWFQLNQQKFMQDSQNRTGTTQDISQLRKSLDDALRSMSHLDSQVMDAM